MRTPDLHPSLQPSQPAVGASSPFSDLAHRKGAAALRRDGQYFFTMGERGDCSILPSLAPRKGPFSILQGPKGQMPVPPRAARLFLHLLFLHHMNANCWVVISQGLGTDSACRAKVRSPSHTQTNKQAHAPTSPPAIPHAQEKGTTFIHCSCLTRNGRTGRSEEVQAQTGSETEDVNERASLHRTPHSSIFGSWACIKRGE